MEHPSRRGCFYWPERCNHKVKFLLKGKNNIPSSFAPGFAATVCALSYTPRAHIIITVSPWRRDTRHVEKSNSASALKRNRKELNLIMNPARCRGHRRKEAQKNCFLQHFFSRQFLLLPLGREANANFFPKPIFRSRIHQ